MASLGDIQRGFARALLSGEDAAVSSWITSRGIDCRERLSIYRNNVRENFLAALEAGFPVLLRLGGETWFRQMAWAYQRRHPSPSGNLFHTGECLAEFLADRLAGSEHEYFADVARLEWLLQESAVAAERGPLPLRQLARLDPADYERLRFELHPAVRLLRSRYPLMRIWQVNQPGAAPETVDLASGPDLLLVRCAGAGTELRRLPEADFAFLAALAARRTLVQTWAAAVEIDPDFAMDQRLGFWVRLNVITGFHIL